jgi:hypothetical protein
VRIEILVSDGVDELDAIGADVVARVVDDGDLVSSGGVTSGLAIAIRSLLAPGSR